MPPHPRPHHPCCLDGDSDGELFVDDSRDRRGSRSPGSVAASAKAASAYTVNAPSVYRAPAALASPAAAAPAPPRVSSKDAADALAGAIAVASMEDEGEAEAAKAGEAEAGGAEHSAAADPAPAVGGAEYENMSSHQAIAGDSSTEALSSGAWAKGNLRLGGERVTSIPRDGSTLDVRLSCFLFWRGRVVVVRGCVGAGSFFGDGVGVLVS